MVLVPRLKHIALKFVGSNIDLIFSQSLHRIELYLTARKVSQEHCQQEGLAKRTIVYRSYQEQLDDYVASINAQLQWEKEKKDGDNNYRVTLKLTVNENTALVNRVVESVGLSRTKCKSQCVEAMVKTCYAHNLNNAILSRTISIQCNVTTNHYSADNLNYTVLSVDELKTLNLQEEERQSILQAVPSSNLRQSHILLIMKPSDKSIDFSFCPMLFNIDFLSVLLKKSQFVERVSCENCCRLATTHVYTILTECVDLMHLNLNNCTYVSIDSVLSYLVELNVDLKSLKLSCTFTKTYQCFQQYFSSSLSRKLISLDFSGVELCEQQVVDILTTCKRLEYLNLSDTRAKECFSHAHTTTPDVSAAKIVIKRLKVLLMDRSQWRDSILSKLVKYNPGIEELGAASLTLVKYSEPIILYNLNNLHTLDISFQGHGAYESFSNISQLPAKLKKLRLCGFVNINLSKIATQCPALQSLIINSSRIDLTLSATDEFPQTIKSFPRLIRLELRGTHCNLEDFFTSLEPVVLKKLILEGDAVTDDLLSKIVNTTNERFELIFGCLEYLELAQCHYLTRYCVEQCQFNFLPALDSLVIKSCSGLKVAFLKRLRLILSKSLKFVYDVQPARFTDYKAVGINITMG